MAGSLIRRVAAAILFVCTVGAGIAAPVAVAQQPSDPSVCGAPPAPPCPGPGGGTDVLSGVIEQPGTSEDRLPKTGGDATVYLAVAAGSLIGALTLRSSARRA